MEWLKCLASEAFLLPKYVRASLRGRPFLLLGLARQKRGAHGGTPLQILALARLFAYHWGG